MMEFKKTIVIGASPNSERFSFKAVKLLNKLGHPVEGIGIKTGLIDNIKIQHGLPVLTDIHTITLYIGKAKQSDYYEYILNSQPKRVIFNPGSENKEFEDRLKKAGIEVIEGCTLVMLNSGNF